MSEQIRSFIAIDIPGAIRTRIDPVLADLAGTGRGLKVVGSDNLHFTIKFLGNIDPGLIQPVREIMRSVTPLLGFEITVGGAGAFPNARNPRVLWIGVRKGREKMVRLARELDGELSGLGFAREKSHVPHLTFARSRNRQGGKAISSFLERSGDLELGDMTVSSLSLKRSVLTPGGPIYSDLHVVEVKG